MDRANDLWLSAAAGDTDAVRRSVAAGADVNQAAKDGKTPLRSAARYGHEAMVRFLVTEAKADVNQADNDSRTPLWSAAFNGHEAIVRLLVTEGNADVNQAANDGSTPLSHARMTSDCYGKIVAMLEDAVNAGEAGEAGEAEEAGEALEAP